MSAFHRWMSAGEGEDSCIGCGVTVPDLSVDIVANHGPLPIFCPGYDLDTSDHVERAHHFTGTERALECARCSLRVTEGTMPNEMQWECVEI